MEHAHFITVGDWIFWQALLSGGGGFEIGPVPVFTVGEAARVAGIIGEHGELFGEGLFRTFLAYPVPALPPSGQVVALESFAPG